MDKILIIATREFIEVVRTKTFIFASVLLPLVMGGSMLGLDYIQDAVKSGQDEEFNIAVVDRAGITETLLARVEIENAGNEASQEGRTYLFDVQTEAYADLQQEEVLAALDARVNADEYYAYLYIPENALALSADAGQTTFGRKTQKAAVSREVRNMIRWSVMTGRAAEQQIPFELAAQILGNVSLTARNVSTGEQTAAFSVAEFMAPFLFMFLMFMSIFGVSQGLLTALLEEKSTRVIELLLSAVSPLQIMAGKILGMVWVGFLLLCVWLGGGAIGMSFAPADINLNIKPTMIIFMMIYFLPSFLLFSSILAGLGSICTTLKEAQNLTTPITIVVVVPLMLWAVITEQPDSIIVRAISYIPLITPFVMMLRISAMETLPVTDIVLTLIVLLISVYFALWAAAKLFRAGILMTGQPPSFSKAIQFLRQA